MNPDDSPLAALGLITLFFLLGVGGVVSLLLALSS